MESISSCLLTREAGNNSNSIETKKYLALYFSKQQSWIKRPQVGKTQLAVKSMVFHGNLNNTGWTKVYNDIRLR